MELEKKLSTLVTSQMPALVHIRELVKPEGYEIVAMKRANTKYGRAVTVTMETAPTPYNPTGMQTAFLPKRFETCLSDDDIAEVNKVTKAYVVRCTNPSSRSPEVTICKGRRA